MTTEVAIIGTGLSAFGKFQEESLKTLGARVIAEALEDAAIEQDGIDMAFVANAVGAVTTGQVAVVGQTVLRAAGFHSIPVFNIDNACAASSSALNLAVQAVRAGSASTVLVLGVEKLYSSDRSKSYRALNGAADIDFVATTGIDVDSESVFVKAIYPGRLARYANAYGLAAETLAKISVKNRMHAGLNPLAQFRKPITIDDVLGARPVAPPLTTLMCAPIGDGASAVIVTSADNARARDRRPVWIRGSAIGMGAPKGQRTSIERVSGTAYAEAGITAAELDVAEVHDATAFTELLAYEELGLCVPGKGATLVDEGATALGGRIPVNPSGGLESRGHPVAATGLAQIVELTWQLRGDAGDRQVPGARYAVAENAGGFAVDDSAAIAVTVLGAA
jgi:acetyl-CoA acetyltransferase